MTQLFQFYVGAVVVIFITFSQLDRVVGTETLALKLLKNKVPNNNLKENKAFSKPEHVDSSSSSSWSTKNGKTPPKNQDAEKRASSYSSGSYDIYTLVAVAAFAALFGALFFELATGGKFRSMGSSSATSSFFGLPLALNTDHITELMSKVSKFMTDIDWMGVVKNATEYGAKSRVLRDVSEQSGVSRWIKAFKKDPIEYQCIRKVACDTLAASSLVERSMKSPFGGAVLSFVGMFIDHGEELQSIVKDTIGNPDKCKYIAPWGFCDDDNDDEVK